MRNISIVLLASTLLFSALAMAGADHQHGPNGGHSHGPISSEAAIKKADRQINSMVERGKLDKSWADAKVTGATQKAFEQGDEWVVTAKNDNASDAAKRSLYIFYTLDGTYVGSNFTGK